MSLRSRAFILPVVLVIIGLLALTMAGFIFFVRAEAAGTAAYGDEQQARLAAESGLEEVIATLRQEGHNALGWYDAPAKFKHMLVWSSRYERENDPVRRSGSRQSLVDEYGTPPPAWRFSVVADRYVDPTGFENRSMRFGITPEASKLNLNTASEAQLRALIIPIALDLGIQNTEELINALLDWRTPTTEPRTGGAKNEYYNTLKPPYNCKSGPFDSVEELLLVKGYTAAILYGEDVNRNGILDPNEDDGDASFPYYDNGDGVLNRGIAPYLTVWSSEPDTALSNKPRINLNQNAAAITAQVATMFTEEELSTFQPVIDFILQLKSQNFNFAQLGSPGELYRGSDTGVETESQPSAAAGALVNSPVTFEQLPMLMDRFSTRAANQAAQPIYGLINVNTAPARVLATIPGITPEAVTLITEMRSGLDAETLKTTAWPLTTGAADVETFHAIAPYITTKAYQFHVEVLGYSDHSQASRRIEWIIEMAGPIAQVRYRRDLTALGRAWPIDNDDIAGRGIEVSTTH